jgi:hypothetical protein
MLMEKGKTDILPYLVVLVSATISLLIVTSTGAMDAAPVAEFKCFNASHVQRVINITNSTGSDLLYAQSLIECNYGCDTMRDVCYKWPYGAIPGEYYLLLEIFALGALMVSLYRIDTTMSKTKVFDVVLPLFMFIIFSLLALQGNNVIDSQSGESVEIVFMVWLNYGLGVFSLIPFFFSVFKFMKGAVGAGK